MDHCIPTNGMIIETGRIPKYEFDSRVVRLHAASFADGLKENITISRFFQM